MVPRRTFPPVAKEAELSPDTIRLIVAAEMSIAASLLVRQETAKIMVQARETLGHLIRERARAGRDLFRMCFDVEATIERWPHLQLDQVERRA